MVLPTVLAGPILRRCDRNEIYVWIATSEDLTIPKYLPSGEVVKQSLELTVYKSPDFFAAADSSNAKLIEIGSNRLAHLKSKNSAILLPPKIDSPQDSNELFAKLNPLNSKLFVYLLRAIPFAKSQFPDDQTLGYEIFLVEETLANNQLKKVTFGISAAFTGAPDLQFDPLAFANRGYSDDPTQVKKGGVFGPWHRAEPILRSNEKKALFPIPTFRLQPKNEDLRVWAGSCFKLHAAPPSATLAMYERLGKICSARPDTNQRPHALLLMGDQIYADDVPHLLAPHIKELAEALLGRENVPDCEKTVQELDARQRKELLKIFKPAFELDADVDNQLFSFGEFAAYYLMHFNPALWPDLITAKQAYRDRVGPVRTRMLDEQRPDIEFSRLSKNREAARLLASVMANTPTYMLCDDHEVTDDLFFERKWIEAVAGKEGQTKDTAAGNKVQSAIGAYICTNGLIAYGLFQTLGNTEEHSAMINGLLNDLGSKKPTELLEQIRSNDWSFITASAPPILFLDTRIGRIGNIANELYPSSHTELKDGRRVIVSPSGAECMLEEATEIVRSPSILMVHPESASKKIAETLRLGKSPNSIVIVTSNPVIGSDSYDRFKLGKKNGDNYAADYEGWRSNLTNFFMLVDLLLDSGVTSCLAIAGDVHFAYSKSIEIRRCDAMMGKFPMLTINQVVASSLLNVFERSYGSGSFPIQRWGTEYFFAKDRPLILRHWHVGAQSQDAPKWMVEKVKEGSVKHSYFGKYYDQADVLETKSREVQEITTNANFFIICIEQSGRLVSKDLVGSKT